MGRKLLVGGVEVGGNKVALDAMKAAMKAIYWVAQHPECHGDLIHALAEADPEGFVLAVEEVNPALYKGPLGMTREQVAKVEEYIRAQQVIPAIKEVRTYTGAGLLEAKLCVETMGERMGIRHGGRWDWNAEG